MELDHSSPQNADKKSCLKLDNVQRKDKGKYELILKNTKGEIKVPVEIEVIDKPNIPQGPLIISDVTDQSAVINWQPPIDDGGLSIDGYIIEKMDEKMGEWTLVIFL